MNWAEQHIQKIETPKTKTKEYIEWGLKLLLTATGITVAFFALMFLGFESCLLYTSPSPRDGLLSRMPSSA